MGLRAKFTLAFLGLSLLIGVCGASAWFFVQRIGGTVSVFAEITSPLLAQTMDLTEAAQRSRGLFLGALATSKPSEATTKSLAELESATKAGMDALRELAARAGLDVKINTIEERQKATNRIMRQMLAAHYN